jgi:hypothetical protein
MSWLRLDDGFPQHPKFEGWRAVDKWALLELMAYCARFRTRGMIPADPDLWPRSTTKRLLAKAVESGFVDDLDGTLWIHDWATYNPNDSTGAERSKRYRERLGKRDFHSDAERDASRDADRDEIVTSRARPRVRSRPVPSPVVEQPSVSPNGPVGEPDPDGRTAGNFYDDLRPRFEPHGGAS